MRKRVVFACLIHETHTFLPRPTTRADFAITLGADIWRKRGDGSIVDGFLESAVAADWEVIPTIDMIGGATGLVDDDAFEHFWSEFSARTIAARTDGIDAIFLCLHGAMATRSFPDAEGELLARIRQLPGAETLPIFGTLDLHGNISERMMSHANGFVAYRENPHTDARDTSVRAAHLLRRCLETGTQVRMPWRGSAVIWTPPGTGTRQDPMLSLEKRAREIETSDPRVWAVNVLAGYSFADTPDTGVSFSLITEDRTDAGHRYLDELVALTWEKRALGNIRYPSASEVLAKILPIEHGPVVLIEAADNIGGGGGGDGTGVLRALLAADVERAVVIIDDAVAVEKCRRAGVGATVELEVGGRTWPIDEGPVALAATVVTLSDGRFELEDVRSHLAASAGRHIDMGPCAVVRRRGITVLLTSKRTPPFDLGQLRSQGIEPTALAVIGVKAAVGHQRAYDPISRASYYVETPGPCASDLNSFTYALLRRPVYPLD